MLKAVAVVEATGLPAVADDTGLEVVALDGEPGVFSARYAGADASYSDNVERLLGELEGVGDRRARFRTAMVLARPHGSPILADGHIDGVITTQPRGGGGFGYDPVFEVDGLTFSEMGVETKNSISHRARAIRALVDAIRAASQAV